MFKKGFTLVEIMIVLTIIGIIAAITFPVAYKTMPDKNVMKFKKANATLGKVIQELVTLDKYYKDGMLSYRADGSQVLGGFRVDGSVIGTDADVKYFCKTFAQIISVKSLNCSTAITAVNDARNTYVIIPSKGEPTYPAVSLEDGKSVFDTACLEKASTVGAEILSSDNITYYQVNPSAAFGINWGNELLFEKKDANMLFDHYKIFCIDIDGISQGEHPFGYGIRVDGKILPGARAEEWMKKSISEKE